MPISDSEGVGSIMAVTIISPLVEGGVFASGSAVKKKAKKKAASARIKNKGGKSKKTRVGKKATKTTKKALPKRLKKAAPKRTTLKKKAPKTGVAKKAAPKKLKKIIRTRAR